MAIHFFSATVQKSPMSIPARVLVELQLDRVVYFVPRRGTDEQREELAELLGTALLTRVPLKRGHNREMWLCRPKDNLSDADYILDYEALLRHVFGEKCRTRVRVCWKGGAL